MRKVLALLLALMMCFGIFAACASDTEDPASPDTTDETGKTEDPGKTDEPDTSTEDPDKTDEPAEETLKPGMQADGTTFVGILDQTDEFTLVIETPGTSGDERIGVPAEAGKVGIASYNMAGTKRNKVFTVDWASLGLEGYPWEYFGATFKLDVSDEANPKLLNTPTKTSYVFVFSQVSVATDANNITTVTLPDGSTFETQNVHYGMIRPNNLLNEGGWFIPKWNDLSGGSTNIFTQEKFMKDYYFYCRCELYDQEMALYMPTTPREYTGPKSPNAEIAQ